MRQTRADERHEHDAEPSEDVYAENSERPFHSEGEQAAA